jgi:hypothetical protein
MLTEGKEAYTKFALKHYDWERIEKTKGELIDAVALLILNSCSTVLVNTSVSPNRLLWISHEPVNDYGGNIGKVDGYEGKTRYSSSRMLAEGKEAYTKFALKHYDWERIEKTSGSR